MQRAVYNERGFTPDVQEKERDGERERERGGEGGQAERVKRGKTAGLRVQLIADS
jgi:hypothetical protein